MYQKARLQDTPIPKSLNAILKRSGDYKSQLEVQFGVTDPICKLLDEFMVFSTQYNELLHMVPETISRNSFVVNNGIEKLLQEWNILSRASEQRLIGGLKKDLEEASRLAKTFCKKWNSILQNTDYRLQEPVVYFEKLFRISRSIYAPRIPVISIPLTDFDQSENWQSLAHEFSHHIFWNGCSPDEISNTHERLREKVSAKLISPNGGNVRFLQQQVNRAELWDNWLEEVFADVYGTLLAGLPYAVSAQDRMADQVNRAEDFLIADHEHPCAYLRPLLSLYTLDLIEAQKPGGQAEIESLKKRWSKFSNGAGELKYKNISLADLAEDARKVVEIVVCGDYWPVSFDPVLKLAGSIQRGNKVPKLEPIVDQDPLTLSYPDLDSVTLPPKFEEIKQQLLKSSTQLAITSRLPRLDENAKLLTWLSLTGLELSDKGNYAIHGCTGDHSHSEQPFWTRWRSHTHSEDGAVVLC